MYGIAIKEMGLVPELMKLHPSTTMMNGDIPEITTNIELTRQEILTLHSWLNND
jgi:hypothetical protein